MIGCERAAQLEIVTKHPLPEVSQHHSSLVGILLVVRWEILSKYSYNLVDTPIFIIMLVLSELLSYLFDYFIFHFDLICAIWDLYAKALAEEIAIQGVSPQVTKLWVDSTTFLERLLLSKHGPLYLQI